MNLAINKFNEEYYLIFNKFSNWKDSFILSIT